MCRRYLRRFHSYRRFHLCLHFHPRQILPGKHLPRLLLVRLGKRLQALSRPLLDAATRALQRLQGMDVLRRQRHAPTSRGRLPHALPPSPTWTITDFRPFLKISLYFLILHHSFRVRLNNRISFPNNRYCVLDKIAVILHPIKNGRFCALKIGKF